MNQQNKQYDKPKKEHRFDPELLKKGLKCDLDKYEFLKECSKKGEEGKKDWNRWRKSNSLEDILLEGADFKKWHLESANLKNAYLESADFEGAHLENAYLGGHLEGAHLKDAKFYIAHLEGTELEEADLRNANLVEANLRGTNLRRADLKSAQCKLAIVNSTTILAGCSIDRYTDFRCVGLESIRIEPRTRQLLEYNIRRMNWEEWYKEHRFLKWLIKPFWWISDYGISTKRIIFTFFGLAFVFALMYRLFPNFVKVYGDVGDIQGFWHALYFSVVTMTTLGFGDIAANPDSWLGQTLLMIQVILGYVLLGALVTRFAVLFAAGGPAGKFANEKEKKEKNKKV